MTYIRANMSVKERVIRLLKDNRFWAALFALLLSLGLVSPEIADFLKSIVYLFII